MTIHELVPRVFGRRLAPVRTVRPGFGTDLDALFDEMWRGFGSAPSAPAGFSPRIDVSDNEKELKVTAELPGLEEKDFDVSLDGDVLTLSGEKKTEHEEEREGWRHVERTSGSFHRALRIPFEVDPDAVEASFAKGVLTVTLPKPTEVQSRVRTIPVSTS